MRPWGPACGVRHACNPGSLTVARVRVQTTWYSVPEALRVAASQFLDMTRAQIEGVAKQTLVHT